MSRLNQLLKVFIRIVVIFFSIATATEICFSQSPENTTKTVFSSVYTKLNNDACQEIRTQSESDSEDLPLICKGYQDYKIYVDPQGATTSLYIGKNIPNGNDFDSTNQNLTELIVNSISESNVIEWRLVNGIPFACIVRRKIDGYISPNRQNQSGSVSLLIVQNLSGFKQFYFQISPQKYKNANKIARRKADTNYQKL